MPPLPLGRTGTRYARAMNKLGWHWWPSDITVATKEYNGRAPCINLGHCTPGCAQGAKASTDITYWPEAIRAGVELRPRCRVREITTNEHGMASGVDLLRCRRGGAISAGRGGHPGLQRHRHAAPAAELGFGAVSQRAGQFQWPGRQEPDAASVAAGPRLCRRARWTAIARPCSVLWSKEFYETDPSRDFVRGYTLQFAPRQRRGQRGCQQRGRGRLPWGEDHHRRLSPAARIALRIGVACEDLPEEHNRVTLDPVLKDSHGIPAPKIDYTISENTRRMMEHGIARATEILTAAGATNLVHRAPS